MRVGRDAAPVSVANLDASHDLGRPAGQKPAWVIRPSRSGRRERDKRSDAAWRADGRGCSPARSVRACGAGSPGNTRAATAKSVACAPRRATPRIGGKAKERKTGDPPRPSKATGADIACLRGPSPTDDTGAALRV